MPTLLPITTGIDHLLAPGRGVGGSEGAESDELRVACFMGLVSFLASRPEVLRVAPLHRSKILNAVAKAIAHSATTVTTTETALTSAGLDGTGEVIQVSARSSEALVHSARKPAQRVFRQQLLFQRLILLLLQVRP